ncbi:MAG: DUF763 domain-containing protein [Sulfolobales archaeon]
MKIMSGIAYLPLHEGHVPRWLLEYMMRLASSILKALYEIYDPRDILRRFSDPLWFQAFNNVIGMDWDSSGSTTVVTAIVKSITWRNDLGFLVLGGKGVHSKDTLKEIPEAVKRFDLGEDSISMYTRISRLTAKIDSSLLQDGYSLYHHTLFISRDGFWCVVQQGMNTAEKMARRYHLSQDTFKEDLLSDPHSGLASNVIVKPLNMIDKESAEARRVIDDLINEESSRLIRMISEVNRILKGLTSLYTYSKGSDLRKDDIRRREFTIPYYKPINISKSFIESINNLQLRNARNIIEALELKGFGPEHVRALALVSDLIFNAPPSNRDPVTHPIDPFLYSFAHGGKDGIPYRVRRDLIERTIMTLEEAIERSRLGEQDKMKMLRRLSKYSDSLLKLEH